MTELFRAARSKTAMIILAGLAGWLAAGYAPSALRRIDMTAFDLYQAAVVPPPSGERVVVVLATGRSLRGVGQWPWSRGVHAKLLGQLNLAKSVVFDVLFPEPSSTDAEGDALFAATAGASGKAVVAVHFESGPEAGGERLVLPYRELVQSVAGVGAVNLRPEPDGVYRDAVFARRYRGQTIPSLPLAAWIAAKGRHPKTYSAGGRVVVDLAMGPVMLEPDGTFKVHHPASEPPVYEYLDVLNGDVSPETFRDALVFIGVNTESTTDFLAVGGGRILPGAVYNAHAAMTLLHGWIPETAPGWAVGLAGAILAAIGMAVGLWEKVRESWLYMTLALVFLAAASATLFFHGRVWLPPVVPALAGVAAYLIAAGVRYRFLSREWMVQSLSIDSLLFLGQRNFDPGDVKFSEYLRARWMEIEEWSGVVLLSPSASEADPEVKHCFDMARGVGVGSDYFMPGQVTVIRGNSRGGNRLLLRLPVWNSGRPRFSVLTWWGEKSAETLKCISALILSTAAYFKALEESSAKHDLFIGVVRLIMGAVDAKDPTTAGHSDRVADLARELAVKLGLCDAEVEEIYLAGLLHDVGKIGIPDSVLNKPGLLTGDEMVLMRRHPSIGSEIMRKIKLPENVIRGILEHHENYDGSGYPSGMKGESLSLSGRILKIADVYDALRSKRQYKEAMDVEAVYEMLGRGAGKEFDPGIIETLLANRFKENDRPTRMYMAS